MVCIYWTLYENQYLDAWRLAQQYTRTYILILHKSISWSRYNTLRPRKNGRHFADDIVECIFLNENIWISIKISLKFVLKGSINNIPSLVQIMAWCRTGDKPLSEPMIVRLLTHICVIRPQWANTNLKYRIGHVLCVLSSHGPYSTHFLISRGHLRNVLFHLLRRCWHDLRRDRQYILGSEMVCLDLIGTSMNLA